MRLFLAFLIIPALGYPAKQGGIELKVENISEIVGNGRGKKKAFFKKLIYDTWINNYILYVSRFSYDPRRYQKQRCGPGIL